MPFYYSSIPEGVFPDGYQPMISQPRGFIDSDGTYHEMTPEPDHYDLDQLRAIELTEICEKLNFPLDKNRRACCPFHNEDTPSFHINPKNFFKCFGCGVGGDSIKFVEMYMEVDFKEAIKWLANMKNIQPGQSPILRKGTYKRTKSTPPARPLTNDELLKAKGWLREMYHTLKLATAGDPRAAAFAKYAFGRGWTTQGLSVLNHEGSLGMLIGNGLGFIYENALKARYKLDDSRSCRWEAGKSKESVWRLQHLEPHMSTVTIFEGETDLIAAASSLQISNVSGFLGAPGASWRPSVAMRNEIGLERDVHLAFDNDIAGRNATAQLAVDFRTVAGCKVYRFNWDTFPQATDIGDVAMKYGKKELEKALASNWIAV